MGPKSKRDKKCDEVYDPWLAAAAQSDFLGVQAYTRCRVGKSGDLGDSHVDDFARSLENDVRHAALGRIQ